MQPTDLLPMALDPRVDEVPDGIRKAIARMIELHNTECLAFMRRMESNSVDAIVTDPPYFGVVDEEWDRQWKNEEHFLEWIGELCAEWQRILRPNGSAYVFASPKMAWGVESEMRKRFNVLMSIAWNKANAGRGAQAEKEAMRNFWPGSERIIFAEHFGADNMAKGEAGYVAKCDELRGFVFEPIRAYLAGEWERAGLTAKDANIATGSQMAGHYLTRVQWTLPTADKYRQLQEYANRTGGEYLRTQYEDLRTQYEDLRRPFNVTPEVPYTDVWTFRAVQAYEGKHVCEKPIALMEHIILASTKPGAIVFDPFTGSGSTGVACVLNGRKFIGCEMDKHWHGYATKRIERAARQPRLFDISPTDEAEAA